MADTQWGHCKACKFFGSPAPQPLSSEEAACRHPTLAKFQLRIYGSNGCSGWALRPGLAPDADRPRSNAPGLVQPGA
jgi:hypothetical protein